MIINHNIPALNTYRSLTINQENTNKSLAKLSSGLRINSAGDDAAGLAISEKMRSQIRGLNQASRNAYDGKSLLNVAEGALNEVHSILQRMKELSVQSANDTNTRFDRGEIQKEVDQLKTEIDRISRDTEFNTMKLLNGTMENRATVTTTGDTDGSFNDKSFKLDITGGVVDAGSYTLSASVSTVGNVSGTVKAIGITDAANMSAITFGSVTQATDGKSTGLGAKYGDYRLDISGNLGGTYDLTLTGPDGKYQILKARDSQTKATFDQLGVTVDFSGGHSITGDGYITFTNYVSDVTFTLKNDDGMEVNLKVGKDQMIRTYTGQDLNLGGVRFQATVGLFSSSGAGLEAKVNVIDNSIKLHIGANEGQNMGISILDSSAKALGINKVDLKEQKTADTAVSLIDTAINRVSSERSKMGAIINRLEHTIKNLGTTSENLTASESRIRDVDMAKEIMDFTKNNILSQAAQSMLAQANALPQGVLGLLR
ncbi:MAG: flagellin [Clostridiales Family XIII bacterium]|jgi:flagellin|nr:flagellin [Clostridiales Family XIII bacterium]